MRHTSALVRTRPSAVWCEQQWRCGGPTGMPAPPLPTSPRRRGVPRTVLLLLPAKEDVLFEVRCCPRVCAETRACIAQDRLRRDRGRHRSTAPAWNRRCHATRRALILGRSWRGLPPLSTASGPAARGWIGQTPACSASCSPRPGGRQTPRRTSTWHLSQLAQVIVSAGVRHWAEAVTAAGRSPTSWPPTSPLLITVSNTVTQ